MMEADTELLRAIQRTCELLERSEASLWSPTSPTEVRRKFLGIAKAIREGVAHDHRDLTLEFAPTSTVQEIAIANGWHDEYVALAGVVDRARS